MLMETLSRWIGGVNDVLWTYVLVAALLGCAVWFTLRTRGVQFRLLGEMMRVLGESFKMNAGYLSIGYTGTDMGGAFFLPKIVGYARACEILMNPNRFGAEKLLEWGFANKVVADDDVVEEAVAFAQQMCDATAPFGLRLTKECLQASLDGTSFENVVKMENRNQVLASHTNDGQMGVGKMNPKNKQDVKDNPEKYQFHNL